MRSPKTRRLTAGVLATLAELGPCTRAEIERYNKWPKAAMGSVLVRLKATKRIHVHDWVYDDEQDARRYPRAVYDLGDKPNKMKPKPKSKAEQNRLYRKRRALKTLSSVWSLAVSQRKRVTVGVRGQSYPPILG